MLVTFITIDDTNSTHFSGLVLCSAYRIKKSAKSHFDFEYGVTDHYMR